MDFNPLLLFWYERRDGGKQRLGTGVGGRASARWRMAGGDSLICGWAGPVSVAAQLSGAPLGVSAAHQASGGPACQAQRGLCTRLPPPRVTAIAPDQASSWQGEGPRLQVVSTSLSPWGRAFSGFLPASQRLLPVAQGRAARRRAVPSPAVPPPHGVPMGFPGSAAHPRPRQALQARATGAFQATSCPASLTSTRASGEELPTGTDLLVLKPL